MADHAFLTATSPMPISAENPLAVQLFHVPFPEVAAALRAAVERITEAWDEAVRSAMPQMANLTAEELRDSTPEILRAIANALASEDPNVIRELVACSPQQGASRFKLKFDVVEVMQEDRLLRAITITEVEAGMGRQMDAAESAALHAAIDIMLQRSVIAMVEMQRAQLAKASAVELKFLSFLSHDLNNNLNAVTLWLRQLEGDLTKAGGFPAAVESLSHVRQAIAETIDGMRRILDYERLGKARDPSSLVPTDLHALANRIVGQARRGAGHPGLVIGVNVPPGTVLTTDGDLVAIILQNLLGNAIKFSDEGAIYLGWDAADKSLYVSDEGPGIPPKHLASIFEAFERGDAKERPGRGLGLAIAFQAVKLLGATLTVDSVVGEGSTFRLVLGDPPRARSF